MLYPAIIIFYSQQFYLKFTQFAIFQITRIKPNLNITIQAKFLKQLALLDAFLEFD